MFYTPLFHIYPGGTLSNFPLAAAGTLDQPLASMKKGIDKATAGDTVYIRGGTYAMSTGIAITKKGTSDNKRIHIWAYQKELPTPKPPPNQLLPPETVERSILDFDFFEW